MRIGLFTDTYRPSINGIVFVVESLKRELEALGHEVFIVCPAKSIMPNKHAEALDEDDYIIRLPSIKGAFFDDYDTSIFFPPKVQANIKKLELDIIHIFTPSQIGLAGVRAAKKNDIPLVIQHCTDMYEFAEHYPAVLPGVLALAGVVFPMSVKLDGRELLEIVKLHRPRRGVTRWNRDIIEKVITMLYSKADAVIALSRKSAEQLDSWQDEEYNYPIDILPNGVDALPRPTKQQVAAFRELWGLNDTDEVFGFVGRLGEEKNLPILIEAFDDYIAEARPRSKLLFVGDFEYKETLEEMAAATHYADRIIFTGALPREELGVAYAVLDIFCFPSLKDTQGWVLHEAAQAKRPIVLIDQKVSEVAVNGESGIFVEDTPRSMADGVIELLEDPKKRRQYGETAKKIASKYTEKRQVAKLEKLYRRIIDER
ncbi:MAG TPA: glycosyltransferase [Candidatus Saccharibacteria bacterium]|nr:glycosyltransferase [Candidatus Saccharibacteria bacterium]HMR38379.1 glycosyltransferase [Candidatus Saccharibacteria bacterium]